MTQPPGESQIIFCKSEATACLGLWLDPFHWTPKGYLLNVIQICQMV